MKKQFIECGKIVSTHGVKGELKVYPFTKNPKHLLNFKRFFLQKDDAEIKVLNARIHKNMLLLVVEGIESIDDAEKLRGKVVSIDRNDDLDEDPYLIDFIGISVSDIDTGKPYGEITDIIITGANDVFVLTDSAGVERLIPDIEDVIIEYDIDEKYMKIRPLEGLFDDED